MAAFHFLAVIFVKECLIVVSLNSWSKYFHFINKSFYQKHLIET